MYMQIHAIHILCNSHVACIEFHVILTCELTSEKLLYTYDANNNNNNGF